MRNYKRKIRIEKNKILISRDKIDFYKSKLEKTPNGFFLNDSNLSIFKTKIRLKKIMKKNLKLDIEKEKNKVIEKYNNEKKDFKNSLKNNDIIN